MTKALRWSRIKYLIYYVTLNIFLCIGCDCRCTQGNPLYDNLTWFYDEWAHQLRVRICARECHYPLALVTCTASFTFSRGPLNCEIQPCNCGCSIASVDE